MMSGRCSVKLSREAGRGGCRRPGNAVVTDGLPAPFATLLVAQAMLSALGGFNRALWPLK